MNELNVYIPKTKLNVKIPFPSCWDDLTAEELEKIASIQIDDAISPVEKRPAYVWALLGNRLKAIKGLPYNWRRKLNLEDIVLQLYPGVEFLFKDRNRFVNPYPIIKYKIGLKKMSLVGPRPHFEDVHVAEMEYCEQNFLKFNTHTDSDYLAAIFAALWRPKGEAFDEETIERRLPFFKSLPPPKLLAMYIWYQGNRNALPSAFPNLYNGKSSGDSIDVMSFTKMIHAGAGPKNGSRKEIRNMKFLEFLYDLDLEAKAAKEMERKFEEAKRKRK